MINLEPAKKVITKDAVGKENGYLIEINKKGRKTTSYLTVAYPGCFKGYHIHCVREALYICIRGKVKVILFTKDGKEEYILDANKPERLPIGLNVPTGLQNEWDEEAWLINTPDPPFDPLLFFEQIDLATEEDAIEWVKNNV